MCARSAAATQSTSSAQAHVCMQQLKVRDPSSRVLSPSPTPHTHAAAAVLMAGASAAAVGTAAAQLQPACPLPCPQTAQPAHKTCTDSPHVPRQGGGMGSQAGRVEVCLCVQGAVQGCNAALMGHLLLPCACVAVAVGRVMRTCTPARAQPPLSGADLLLPVPPLRPA